jgi:hypothetical protein
MAQSGELVSDPHRSPVQTCPHIIIAPLERRWLLSSDVETKNTGCLFFLATQLGSTASLEHVLLGWHFFRTTFVGLLVHRPHESSVNVGLTDIVEFMGKI